MEVHHGGNRGSTNQCPVNSAGCKVDFFQVIRSMQPWAKQSVFSGYIESVSFRNMTGQTPLPSITYLRDDDSSRMEIINSLLWQGITSLNYISSCSKSLELSTFVRQLRDAMRTVHERRSAWTPAEQFRLVHPFAPWGSKHSISFGILIEHDPIQLSIAAHWFAVIIVFAIIFPETNLALIIPIWTKSLCEIESILRTYPVFYCENCRAEHGHDALMAFPLQAIAAYDTLLHEPISIPEGGSEELYHGI
jgi:hypothetical protein